MSVEGRLQKLEATLAARRAPTVVRVEPLVCSTRAELLALDRAGLLTDGPRDNQPTCGRVEIRLVGFTTAAEVLRAAGVTLAPETTETPSEETE
jgi:hypothetical protein